jgi:hypothetical protein
MGTYLRKSVATIFRIYTLYRPLKTFFAIGATLLFLGLLLGGRFLWYFSQGERGGHIQSLILAAVFLITGFHTMLIALLADLIAVNRRLTEDVLIRVKRLESPARPAKQQQPHAQREKFQRADRPQAPAPAPKPATPATPATQWVWLMDEDKLSERTAATDKKPAAPPSRPIVEDDDDDDTQPMPTATAGSGNGRRRRRRRGTRQHTELPGNRGKHLAGEEGGE